MEEATKIKLEYEPQTDVMYVDLCEPRSGAIIDVVDVGGDIGFPGQLLVRIDRDSEEMLGLTIQEYTSFKNRLLWKYRMISVQRAIGLLVNSLRAGFRRAHPSHGLAATF